jgi:cytochrome c peroxidase
MASIRPMLDPREFDGNAASVSAIFRRDPELAACYRRVFNASPFGEPQRTVVNVGKALAAFVETMVTERTPFDEFRDALERGDGAAASLYPAAARRGLQLFVGDAQCIACHSGPNLSDGEFHPGTARAAKPAEVSVAASSAAPAVDGGRLDGAHDLKASPWNLLGPHNDDSSRANAARTRRLLVKEGMRGQFRTPSLRNVEVTGPYMHDGHIDNLRDAIRHAGNPSAEVLTERQVGDLAAFLGTLTDRYGERRPWVTTSAIRCP